MDRLRQVGRQLVEGIGRFSYYRRQPTVVRQPPPRLELTGFIAVRELLLVWKAFWHRHWLTMVLGTTDLLLVAVVLVFLIFEAILWARRQYGAPYIGATVRVQEQVHEEDEIGKEILDDEDMFIPEVENEQEEFISEDQIDDIRVEEGKTEVYTKEDVDVQEDKKCKTWIQLMDDLKFAEDARLHGISLTLEVPEEETDGVQHEVAAEIIGQEIPHDDMQEEIEEGEDMLDTLVSMVTMQSINHLMPELRSELQDTTAQHIPEDTPEYLSSMKESRLLMEDTADDFSDIGIPDASVEPSGVPTPPEICAMHVNAIVITELKEFVDIQDVAKMKATAVVQGEMDFIDIVAADKIVNFKKFVDILEMAKIKEAAVIISEVEVLNVAGAKKIVDIKNVVDIQETAKIKETAVVEGEVDFIDIAEAYKTVDIKRFLDILEMAKIKETAVIISEEEVLNVTGAKKIVDIKKVVDIQEVAKIKEAAVMVSEVEVLNVVASKKIVDIKNVVDIQEVAKMKETAVVEGEVEFIDIAAVHKIVDIGKVVDIQEMAKMKEASVMVSEVEILDVVEGQQVVNVQDYLLLKENTKVMEDLKITWKIVEDVIKKRRKKVVRARIKIDEIEDGDLEIVEIKGEKLLVKRMIRDGNSLFGSYSFLVHNTVPGGPEHRKHVSLMRLAVVKYLMSNSEDYWNYLLEDVSQLAGRYAHLDTDVEKVGQYLYDARDKGFPVGSAFVSAIADFYGVDVVLYTKKLGGVRIWSDNEKVKHTITLLRSKRRNDRGEEVCHFDGVIEVTPIVEPK